MNNPGEVFLIPVAYWLEYHTLDIGRPWLTPEATWALLNCHMTTVIEFGSGGSTLFFARRASRVFSFETSAEWSQKVLAALRQEGLNNVRPALFTDPAEYLAAIATLPTADLILVDCNPSAVSRSKVFAEAAALLAPDGLMVVNNYGGVATPECARAWPYIDYDDPHWWGRGTRIYRKPREAAAAPGHSSQGEVQ